MKRDTLYIYPYRKIEEFNEVGDPIVDNKIDKATEFGCEYQRKTGFVDKTLAGPTNDSYIHRLYVPRQDNMDLLKENISGKLVSERLDICEELTIKKIRPWNTHYAVDIQYSSGDGNE